jgi:hypothetical protein
MSVLPSTDCEGRTGLLSCERVIGPPGGSPCPDRSKLAEVTANGDIMFDHADQIGSLVLAGTIVSEPQVIVAIVVAAIGAVATFAVGLLNYRTQRQGFQWQKDQQGRQLELTLSSQITDRFTNAINQLGSGNKAVRIGGIFALERIA